MNKKRLVALLAAAVMVLGTVPAYGAETSGQGTLVESATDSASTITGDATVNDVVKEDTYVVTLPTKKAFDFYIDPYGIVGMATDQAVDIKPTTGEAAIVVKDNALAVIKNQSNVDVVVDVNIEITATGGALNLVTDQAAVATGTAANMFIALVPGTEMATGEAAYVATGEAIAIAQSGTKASFLLNAATYEIYVNADGGLEYRISPESNNLDAVAFKLGGSINKAADWSPFTTDAGGSISYDVVFDVQKVNTEVRDTTTALYGVVSGTAVVPYTAVAGTTSGDEDTEDTAEVAIIDRASSQTYWYVFADENRTAFDTEKATATVNGKEVDWTVRSACASSLRIADIEAALGTSITAGDYEVVVTVTDNGETTVYEATVTVE